MERMKHWQDPVNALLGAWLIVSPWLLGIQDETRPLANAVVVGVLLVAAALGAVFAPRAWEEWTEALLGLWLAISPWVLGFSGLEPARNAAVATGVAVFVLALWVLLTDKDHQAAFGRKTAQ